MCESSCDKADQDYINALIAKYSGQDYSDVSMIPSDEVENCLLRAFHGNCDEEIMWLGGTRSPKSFVKILKGL